MNPVQSRAKLIAVSIPLLLLSLYGLFLFHKIDLTKADLGRHIRNGEMLLGHPEVLSTNFYSYTFPDYPTTNHHWGAGLIFYGFWKIGGIGATHLVFIALSLAAFYLFFAEARRRAGAALPGLVGLIIVPLLLVRLEIRPEVASYFLAGLFFYWLSRFRANRNSGRWLWLLPILELSWVNLHIYFFFGPVLVLFFLLEAARQKGWNSASTKRLLLIFILTSLACLANPFGLRGALAPLTIFRAYGYPVLENSPVWFLQKVIPSAFFTIFKVVSALLLGSFLVLAIKKPKSLKLPEILLSVMLIVMAWTALRNFAIFGFFTLPILAGNLKTAMTPFTSPPHEGEFKSWPVLGLILFIFLLTLSGKLPALSPYNRDFGLGEVPLNGAAADFFQFHNLQGPLFNNYDIGGYLIYHLFPAERVFVDNRPEAYPPEFFRQEYIPMQEDPAKWRQAEERYHFNAIVFAYRDATPWGQKFIIERVQDPAWAPVFADGEVIILLKRNEKNSQVISRYEIPKKNFRVIPNQQ